MSVQAISLILFNGVTTAFVVKYVIQYVYKKVTTEKDEQTLLLLDKINKLETEVNELHETIDILEEKIQAKESLLKESSEILFNKIDKFIISNYDTV
jgi:hypothetical protein